jgi:hypothetical protein
VEHSASGRKLSASRFPTLNSPWSLKAFTIEGIYDRKIVYFYYTRKDELPGLFNAAQRLGVSLDHRLIKQRTNEGIFRVTVARSKTG